MKWGFKLKRNSIWPKCVIEKFINPFITGYYGEDIFINDCVIIIVRTPMIINQCVFVI